MKKDTLTLKLIKEFISLYTELYNIGYIIEHKDLRTNQASTTKYELTWSTRDNTANITFDESMNINMIFDELLSNQQFSMLFYDKSILQVEYKIEEGQIIKQRLQFIKKSNITRSKQEIQQLENNKSEVESPDWFKIEEGIPIILRHDFDPQNYIEIEHPTSHFVISNANNCRIPMKANISLTQFVIFIMHNIYNEFSFDHINKLNYATVISREEKKRIHMNW